MAQDSTFHAIVKGQVQGVGFRYFVLGKARALGLRGKVRNLESGSVEVLAQGPEDKLQELMNALHEGPPVGKVEKVEANWGVAVPEMFDFTIGF